MLNDDVMKGKWKEIKGSIQKAWGDLTDDDLEGSKGDMNKISGLIQQKYGMKKEEVSLKLNDLVSRFGQKDKKEEPKEPIH